MNTKNFAARFRSLREHRGLTQDEMATQLGIGPKYLGMIETGKKEVEPDGSLGLLFAALERAEFGDETPVVRTDPPDYSPRGKLRTAIHDAGLTPATVAKKIGYQIGVVQAVVDGGARIKEDMARKIERLRIGVSADELLEGSEIPKVLDRSGMTGTVGAIPGLESIGAGKVRMIPLISMAQAGPKINFEDEVFQHEATAVFDVNDARAFGVKIRGDSMEPVIKEGDVAIVCPTWQPRNGDEVICRTVDGDVMCKIYQTKANGQFVILSSYNPAFPPRELSRDEIEWVYPVQGIQKTRRRE